ncbi:MAG: PEGA domain-containing protein [Candidatus Omnitrophica bacterium]|nr:PEGA domain-containing protein [Candidatus Omnitrophota bacterium]
MAIIRRILFFIFLATYLIACPLLILYSFGYIFIPIKQGLTQTGLIYLSSTPKGADVYLEKSHYRQKTPTTINGLIPGNYKITLKQKGYQPWVQTVLVDVGKAAAFKNILLVPKMWPVENIISKDFVKLVPLRQANGFIVATSAHLGSYAVYDFKKKDLTPLVPSDSSFFTLPVDSIFSEENSSIFIIYGGSLWGHKYVYVNFAKTPQEILDISKLIDEKSADLFWSDSNRSKILAFHGDYLDLLDTEEMSVSPRYVENVKGYGATAKWVYTMDMENNVLRHLYHPVEKQPFLDNAQFDEDLLGESRPYKIKVLDGDNILLLGPKGQLVVNLPPYNLAKDGVVGLEFYKKIFTLLYWTKQSINLVDFSEQPENQSPVKKGVHQSIVYENGKNITDCFFVDEGMHIIFKDNDRLYLLEIEPAGPPHVEFLAEVKKDSSFFYAQETGAVYYLDSQTRHLNSIQVVPK